MNMIVRAQPRLPHDHIGFLIARHGWWRVAVGFALASVMRPFPRAPRTPKAGGGFPMSDHLRRDIGMAPQGPPPPSALWR